MVKIKFEAELSYYYLYLLSFLRENQPEMADDEDFIKVRSDQAAAVFEQARRDGYPTEGAQELAMSTLLEELHFSSYDMISEILQKEFVNEIDQNEIQQLVSKLIPELKTILDKYQLSDEFPTSPEYEHLYNELVGTILTLLENGI